MVGAFEAQLDRARWGELDLEGVGERNGLEDRTQLMKPVFAPVQDLEVEIELGVGAQANVAGGGHCAV